MTRFSVLYEPDDGEAAEPRTANWRDRTPEAVLNHWARGLSRNGHGPVIDRSDQHVTYRTDTGTVTVTILQDQP